MLSSSYSTAHVSYMMVCPIESINSAKVKLGWTFIQFWVPWRGTTWQNSSCFTCIPWEAYREPLQAAMKAYLSIGLSFSVFLWYLLAEFLCVPMKFLTQYGNAQAKSLLEQGRSNPVPIPGSVFVERKYWSKLSKYCLIWLIMKKVLVGPIIW